MDQQLILITIAGMAVVTYVPRALPLLALARRGLNPAFERWLSFVPTAVLSAMLAQSLIVRDGEFVFAPTNIFLAAAIPTFLVSICTRSFFGAVAVGMAVVALGRYYLGLS